MEIKVLCLGHISVNCYLISTDSAAVVIDPGFNSLEVEDFLKENSKKERMIILTHSHFDHSGGALNLRETTGTKIAIGEFEADALLDPEINLSARFRTHQAPFKPDLYLKDGEIFTVGDLEFKVILTTGHTKGGISLLLGDKLFSGDTLFYQSIGRTDFPTGDFSALERSIKMLYALPDETIVYPGHGDSTTIGFEKKYNPFVRQ